MLSDPIAGIASAPRALALAPTGPKVAASNEETVVIAMAARTCFGSLVVIACVAYLSLGPGEAVAAQNTYSLTRPAGGDASPATVPTSAAAASGVQAAAPLKEEELEQLVAPVALYPDSLLAQVLMASTYPLEVVQAERWVKQNPTLKDSPDALNNLTWDPSVKSLIDFPQVLTMMSEKLDWTVKLGDAFIADQKAIMDAVQRLRGKAYAEGNLKSSNEQTVKVEPAPAADAAQPAGAASASPQVIVVESSSPTTVYVPTYNPAVVYGGWPYPAYPPYYYYPPGYVAGTAMVSFGVGVAVGAAWGHAWGDCDWNGGDVDVDIDQNVNFNGNIDREKYKAERDARQTERQGSQDARQTERQGSRDARQADRGGRGSTFQHDPSHRQGVAYRDSATSERFRGSGASQMTAQSRDAYRGRAEAGRQELGRGAADGYRGGGGTGARTGTGDYYRSGGGSGGRQSSAQSRDYSGTRSNGFSGAGSSSNSTRAASSRGQSSRSGSYGGSRGSYSEGSRGGYSGGSRGGYSGGGGRGGGGGRAGGGGGRGGGGRR
jgi:hypothetical protein